MPRAGEEENRRRGEEETNDPGGVANPIARRLADLRRRGRKAFAPFIMAGYPSLAATKELLAGLAEAGADLIELGLPFSDPLADGPTNQAAAYQALTGGATIDKILAGLEEITPSLSCPAMLFTYFNPVLQRGLERFLDEAARSGAAGFVIPDLPPEAAGELRALADQRNLGLTFLAAPTSTPERITLADRASTAFLYAVSLRGVTGARRELPADLPDFLGRVKKITHNPVLVGFGVSTGEQAQAAAALADGVIVGSALVRLAGEHGIEAACTLARELRRAVSEA